LEEKHLIIYYVYIYVISRFLLHKSRRDGYLVLFLFSIILVLFSDDLYEYLLQECLWKFSVSWKFFR